MMMKEQLRKPDAALWQAVYTNAGRGCEAVLTVLGKTKREDLRTVLTAELEGYQHFAHTAKKRLEALSEEAKDVELSEKISSALFLRVATLVDDSASELAELAMSSFSTDMVRLQKEINIAQQMGAEWETIQMANKVIAFQQENINKMKHFL